MSKCQRTHELNAWRQIPQSGVQPLKPRPGGSARAHGVDLEQEGLLMPGLRLVSIPEVSPASLEDPSCLLALNIGRVAPVRHPGRSLQSTRSPSSTASEE